MMSFKQSLESRLFVSILFCIEERARDSSRPASMDDLEASVRSPTTCSRTTFGFAKSGVHPHRILQETLCLQEAQRLSALGPVSQARSTKRGSLRLLLREAWHR